MSDPYGTSSRKADKLLHTKLMPPRPHSAVILRDNLLARLDAGLTKKLTLITSPTGFGKTTLASMWAANGSFAPAWVTLDGNDNDPTRFWTYMVSALRTFDPALGRATLSALAAPQPAPTQTLLEALINDMMGGEERRVLLLDEYQSITAPEINEGMAFLIQQLPEAYHMVLISRSEPALDLGLLRARGELAEITRADLQFSLVETQVFLRETLAGELAPGMAVLLQERTEGWAAGLRLASLSLQNKNPEEAEKIIQTFSGRHRYVSDYLIKEVFNRQDEAVQNFLLQTCFLNRLTASLCDALTETITGASTLENLERANLFLVRLEHAGEQTWYRYNPMFAESIQALAKQRLDEGIIRSLFERASEWYEYHGLYDDAIESALSAKEYARAIRLIEKYIEIHDMSELQTLRRWIESIPQAELLLHPTICFTLAQVILYAGDRFAAATAAKLEPYLGAAESIWHSQDNRSRLGQVLSLRGTIAWWQGDLQKACEYARQSLDNLAESEALWRGNSLLIVGQAALEEGRVLEAQESILEARALSGAAQNLYAVLAATQLLSKVFYEQGELEQVELLGRQIQSEAVGDESMLDDQGEAALLLAGCTYERNELDKAKQYAEHALELGEQRGNEMLQAQASIQMARIHAAENEWREAHDLLMAHLGRLQIPAGLGKVQNELRRLTIRTGEIPTLEGGMNALPMEEQESSSMQKEAEDFTLARLRIAEGRKEEALALLETWKRDAVENGRVRSQVEALNLEALAQNSNPEKAAKTLAQALAIGKERGFQRIYLDEGSRMADLLQASLSRLANRTVRLFATTLLHSFPAEMQAQEIAGEGAAWSDALSGQELRVLRLLAAGYSNPAIAQELVVSTNTIKTQVKSIYHKLNVNSRSEARDVARALHLLD
ncbi:MAG TPA: LuxR C-terminal-related transcriptional regulator [Terriglobia bacterium]|nr:LuxR C-terminal-related transcriptional regulator [Terriglobia bacterium]